MNQLGSNVRPQELLCYKLHLLFGTVMTAYLYQFIPDLILSKKVIKCEFKNLFKSSNLSLDPRPNLPINNNKFTKADLENRFG